MFLNPITINDIQTKNQELTSGYCIFQGILKVGFDLSSILWTTLIIYSVFASVVLKINLQSKQVFYILIAFLLPFIAAIIPAFFNQYGFVQYFCWFQSPGDSETQFWLKMGFFFIPLWVFFIINITLATITYVSLKKIQLQPRLLVIFKRLMWFPFIMFVTGLFATLDTIYQQVNGSILPWLNTTGLVLLSLYGFFNAVAYGFNPLIRQKIQFCITGRTESVTSGIPDGGDEVSESSRNTQKIQAQLYDLRSARANTQPVILLNKK